MTLAEFKAWLEGFTEAMDGPPNADQWSKIQGKIKSIAGPVVLPKDVFRDAQRWINEPPMTARFGQLRASDVPMVAGQSTCSADNKTRVLA